jgi:hypothetical protein
VEAAKTQDYPFVTFVRYGTFYFFSEFHHQAEGFDAKLPRLTVDKRILMKYGRPDNVVLVATSTSGHPGKVFEPGFTQSGMITIVGREPAIRRDGITEPFAEG